MHLGSTVHSQIADDKDAIDAIASVLPAGTLSGAPKIRACEIIDELEGYKRGVYGGAIGYIDLRAIWIAASASAWPIRRAITCTFAPGPASLPTAYRNRNMKNV